LFLVTFAAAGSRGGAVLPILGSAGLLWLISLRQREGRRAHTWALGVVVVAIAAATFGVTRSSGSFRVDPLNFLPGRVAGQGIPVAEIASIAVMLAMTASIALIGRWSPRPVLIGAALAGILGLVLFGHPAYSQLYFFHAAWPVIVVGLAVLLAGAVRALGPAVLAALALAVLAVQAVLAPPALLPPTSWPVRAAIAALCALPAIGACAAVLVRHHGWSRTAIFALPVLIIALQPWGVPQILNPAAVVRTATTSRTVSNGQLHLLDLLRTRSDPTDLVATNKHCLSGTQTARTCDARWFAVAAFAERRVLMEGWSYDYTWSSAGNDNLEPYWHPALLRANDGFIAAPSVATCRVLSKAGVRWIYVDMRERWSPHLADYADTIAATADAALYRLHRSCA
jgi:hypothetical protein